MATRFPISAVTNDLASFRRAFEPFFNEPRVSAQAGASRQEGLLIGARSLLPIDAFATGDDVIVLAAVPGMNPEEISISVEKNVVTLSGAIANSADPDDMQGATWFLHELSHGDFKRSLQLPFEVDADHAAATFENGLLRLTLPEKESAKPRQIRVNASSASGSSTGSPEAIDVQSESTSNTEPATVDAGENH
ncbi:MAG: Hsp20/alpha crystallin family protein [Thermomicrobiales bacterium]